jgi:flagellar biosynthesis/type III secretory pathway protein FliH
MSTVIRSVSFSEPVLLLRNAPGRPVPGELPCERELEAEPPMAVPAAPEISYEEYERRFAVELEAQRQEAAERGWLEGREAGLAKAASEQAAQLKALGALLRSARGRLDEGIGELSELGAQIAFEAVCKVLGQAMATREGALAAVRETVRRARERSRLTLRVSPGDFAMLHQHLDAVLEGLEAGQVEVAADERVELGGCLLETPSGQLDGRLEVQLAGLRRALLESRAAREPGDSRAAREPADALAARGSESK